VIHHRERGGKEEGTEEGEVIDLPFLSASFPASVLSVANKPIRPIDGTLVE